MDKGILAIIAMVIFFIILIVINGTYLRKEKFKCNDLGGVYIESQCFKAELIKLD